MASQIVTLLTARRFVPLFVVQFLGAFNDNLLKFALLFMANFGLYAAEPEKAKILAAMATGLFILPYVLFSAWAGQIADAVDKARLVRWVKAAEVVIMLVALFGFFTQSVAILLLSLFAMGMHSTLFGPVKYSILPQHLPGNEIMAGTGLIEGGTFLAILGGQLLAGLISPGQAGFALLALAVMGYLAALAIPAAPPQRADPIDWAPLKGIKDVLALARVGRDLWWAILGTSWFFAVGAVLVAEFAPLVSGTLGAQQNVATLFLVIFSLAIAAGALAINSLQQGEVSPRYVPASLLLLALGFFGLWSATSAYQVQIPEASIAQFVTSSGAIPILVSLWVVAFAGGLFIVPLYAIIQVRSPEGECSRLIAANNIMNAAFTVVAVLVVSALLALGMDVPGLIGWLAVTTLALAVFTVWLMPEMVIKGVARLILRLLYRVEIRGLAHLPRDGERAVIVVNHLSLIDGLLLGAFLPCQPTFAVFTAYAEAWWMRPLTRVVKIFPVDPTNPMAAKAMVKTVRDGNVLVIFPEGRITVTGALMKMFDGPGMVADKADAPIIPVRLDGPQYTPFSRLKGKVRTRWFPKITITVLEPRRFQIEGEMSARQRRDVTGRRLYDEMSAMIFATSRTDTTLYAALLEARAIHGGSAEVLEDIKRAPLSYDRLLIGTRLLGQPFARATEAGEIVGVMLPNINAAVASFFALQGEGRVPAMLNFTAGPANIASACATARIRTVITARAFIDQAKLAPVIDLLKGQGLTLLFLEDLAEQITTRDKISAFLTKGWIGLRYAKSAISPDAPAVVLFTSGSEGAPKGVVLTHRNLLSNLAQLAARIDFNASDVVLNALPVFHSFGLTGGTLLPLLNGIRTVMYPSPLHYRIVPALAYDANATIMFGTDTFLSGYARMAHGYDFYSLRYIFAGAEKIRTETRQIYADKFGLRIMEGYGATECSPVISVNTPMHYQAGSVGRLLPGIEARLEPVPGITDGARLLVRGPNVMAGYLLASDPGVLHLPQDGWHDTGDIVTLDGDGFITIKGRAKRFAKIGGEMVSLPAVEGYAARCWPAYHHAVVSRPDPKKGEALVLLTTHPAADLKDLLLWARNNGITELMIPRDIRFIADLPVLGTGKLDYVSLTQMAVNPGPSDIPQEPEHTSATGEEEAH